MLSTYLVHIHEKPDRFAHEFAFPEHAPSRCHPAGNAPRSHALLALMLLSSARFPTRIGDHGDLLRLDDQDRSKWDQSLIERGLIHLAKAAHGDELTGYHLQAGIAACHCTAVASASTDWTRILSHYDELYGIKGSPVIALNRAVAIANVHGAQAGLDAVAAMEQRDRLESNHLLYAVTGELQNRLGQFEAAAENFRRALELSCVGPEQVHLTRMLESRRRVIASTGSQALAKAAPLRD